MTFERPPGHRAPTDEEMKSLPRGTKSFDKINGIWWPSMRHGKPGIRPKAEYAIPVVTQKRKDRKLASINPFTTTGA